ncbi:MAG: condensation domain-containing protein [Lachnospiraceae bacterium]|nr:condensation domain-containing protein [Lachnospiraceae bacterium]MDD7025602.1 condensation domain-containing protein [Lachnospiraceae bacterium]MDY5701196.1 condensation domain-containing protein [Lachnospiraceae bacterium]
MKTRKGYKTYPLTVAQKFHFFYMDYCPKKEVVNVGTSLTIQYDIDRDVLYKAIMQAYERCESMRIRFAYDKKEKEWYQYIPDHEDFWIDYVDFRGQTMEEAEKTMKEWTRIPFPREDSPMNRIVMITTPDGYNGIYLLGDHLILDAQSLIAFLRDIIEIYCSMMYEEIEYPKPMRSYLEQLQKDLEYEAGSKAQQRDREYFYKLIERSEPIYNGIDGPAALERERETDPEARAALFISQNVNAQLDIFHLEAEPTSRLMKFCEEQHISLQCLLIMGIRTYLQKMNGNEDVSINVAYARRATLAEKKSGGTRIHSFPFRTIISEDKTFLEGILHIRDEQNETFRHTNFNPVEYMTYRRKLYNLKPGRTYEPMSLTYQPLTLKDKGLTQLGDIHYKTKWYPNGASTQAMYLTVMHRTDDNGLDFNFEHQVEAVTVEKLEYFYYYLCKIMFKGIENPHLSIGEIIKLV